MKKRQWKMLLHAQYIINIDNWQMWWMWSIWMKNPGMWRSSWNLMFSGIVWNPQHGFPVSFCILFVNQNCLYMPLKNEVLSFPFKSFQIVHPNDTQFTYHWSCYLGNCYLSLVLNFFQMMFPGVITMGLMLLFCSPNIMTFIVKVITLVLESCLSS